MIKEPKIKIGEYDVISSGEILTHDNHDISFDFESIMFTFSFVCDENKEKSKLNAHVDENNKNHLHIELINFDNSLGRGLINPIEVGELEGKKLYIQFIVSNLETKSTRIFEYTWLTNKKED